MNSNIKSLVKITKKESRLIIGLMSGTSLDGLDVALCEFSGSGIDTKIKLLNFHTIPYTPLTKEKLKSVFCKRTIDLQNLCLLHSWIGTMHADMVLESLQKWSIDPSQVDLIASHGQTIYHAPKSLHGISNMPNSTLQIGDGDHISHKTGIVTISDFRQKHVANGNEGAPLAFFGDYLLFSKQGETRIMLNIGGIANFTFLPANLDITKVFCTDTGPGNTLIDSCVRQFYLKNNQSLSCDYDKDGEIAKSGRVHESLLTQLKNHPFFQWTKDSLSKGKTTGQELFNSDYVFQAQKITNTENIDEKDLISTLTRFTAETITDSIQQKCSHRQLKDERIKIFISGGGKHNCTMMAHLRQLLHVNFKFYDMEETSGILSDAKEAILFATLANETICGHNNCFQGIASVSMGKISFPK